MRKYWIIIKNELQKQFIHRFYIISFAAGNFFELLTQIIVWSAIFSTTDTVSGYTHEQMLSYVIFGWIFRFLTTNYEYEYLIHKDIHLGTLSNFLVKPVNYIKYILADSIGRLGIAIFIIMLQAGIWIFIFHEKIVATTNISAFFVLIVMFILSYLIKFFLAVVIGSVGFWTKEVTGVSYSLNVVIKFLSGSYFPLDLLPAKILAIFHWFPFAYTFFVPTQVILGRTAPIEALQGIGIMLIWLLLLYLIVKFLWKLGLKKYESAGI